VKLFWKLFVGLGVAMTLTLVGAIFISFRLASLAFDQMNIENRESTIEVAARELATGGPEGLTAWLRAHPSPAPGIEVLILDPEGRDLLGRPLPPRFERLLGERFRRPSDAPRNFRPPRFAATLEAPSGAEFQLLFVRTRITVLGILSWPATQLAVLVIAVFAAAITALLLARSLATPIVRLQRATRALAAGSLGARVGPPIVRRRDEVGTLARDFDAMATKIEALVTSKETLLRDVSHELRSPLARIRVALALAQRKAGGEAQPDLTRIERETERLDELVGQILTLARLRSEAPSGQVPVDLEAIVADAVADARFEAANVSIDATLAQVPSIEGAPLELTSAVENVLRNAVAYSPARGRVAVDLATREDSIELVVRDQGPGVEADALERLFEPFFRSDSSRNHAAGGFGLGLAIAAGVVERHAGRIDAANVEPTGLEVRIRLPVAGAADDAALAEPAGGRIAADGTA
jgi:two-component system sensor histidine kinase CpxA